jgi:hypothetical protein
VLAALMRFDSRCTAHYARWRCGLEPQSELDSISADVIWIRLSEMR